MRPKIEKMRKNCEKVAQDPAKRTIHKTSAGYAMPCLESDRTKIGPFQHKVQPRWGGTPAHCLRFARPAEAASRSEAGRIRSNVDMLTHRTALWTVHIWRTVHIDPNASESSETRCGPESR